MFELEVCVNPWHNSGNYGRGGGVRAFSVCPECSPTREAQLAQLAEAGYNLRNSSHEIEREQVFCATEGRGHEGAHFDNSECLFPHFVGKHAKV